MLVTVPQSDVHSMVQLMVATPKGMLDIVLDQSHKTFDIPLPAGVKDHEVAVTAQFLTSGGQPDKNSDITVLKEATVAKKPEPKPEPKPTPAPAPKVETKPEPKPEPTVETKTE